MMESLTIQNVDEDMRARLSIAAASHGCSIEEEARGILQRALGSAPDEKGFATRIHQRFARLNLTEFEIHVRSDLARSADLDEA